MHRTIVFFIIILLEGYVVLASELLAIRQLIPFVGNGTETIAIIIAAVLMPLSFGYSAGGRFKPYTHKGSVITIRKKIIYNILKSALILSIGLSYVLLENFFLFIHALGYTNRVAQATFYSILFIVYPVFLLGQTVPLVSNYFSKRKLSKVTGQMLFFSTMGSFLGSIISTLILMSTIGVHNTVIFTLTLLALPVFLLNKKIISWSNGAISCIIVFTIIFNNNNMMANHGIIENNNYSTITITEHPEYNTRSLGINRSNSSRYSDNFEYLFDYIKYVESTFIRPTHDIKTPKSILVIGAGGFTLGLQDEKNDYSFIDIDKSLKHISEDHLLKQQLTPNKKFIAEPARAFLIRDTKHYDFIVLDAYSNINNIPPQLITKEFFSQVKKSLKPGGIMVFNAVVSPNFTTDYSIKLDNTIRAVFPHITRRDIQPYNAWSERRRPINMIYTYINRDYTDGIYSDNLNTYYLDR